MIRKILLIAMAAAVLSFTGLVVNSHVRVPFVRQLLFPIFELSLIVVVFASVAGVIALVRSANRAATAKFAAEFPYAFLGGDTGIAVCPQRRQIKLRDGGREKTYALSDVRNWENVKQTGGELQALGGGLGAASHVMGHNLGNSLRNRRATGLFITVRDIDVPVWRVAILDLREQQRWMEILQQSINESAPTAAGSAVQS